MTVLFTGSRSCAEVRLPSFGYENDQANWRAVTFTSTWSLGTCSFLTRTTPETMEIAVTRTAGIAVQRISTPVWPWIGGPSESSSGFTRNLISEYAITAATSANTAIAIPVVNQKTKSIRSRCREATGGSQGMSTATSVARPPNRTPSPTSWRIEPLRTGNRA